MKDKHKYPLIMLLLALLCGVGAVINKDFGFIALSALCCVAIFFGAIILEE